MAGVTIKSGTNYLTIFQGTTLVAALAPGQARDGPAGLTTEIVTAQQYADAQALLHPAPTPPTPVVPIQVGDIVALQAIPGALPANPDQATSAAIATALAATASVPGSAVLAIAAAGNMAAVVASNPALALRLQAAVAAASA